MTSLILHVNGHDRSVEVDPKTPLIYVLRNDFGLKGTKLGCGLEQCGVCLVIVDGKPEYACNTPVGAFEGRKIITIEGIGTQEKLHPIQKAFITERAAQCGYCIPGMIVATKALLDSNPDPSKYEIQEALSEVFCRCGTHVSIINAVFRAAKDMRS